MRDYDAKKEQEKIYIFMKKRLYYNIITVMFKVIIQNIIIKLILKDILYYMLLNV